MTKKKPAGATPRRYDEAYKQEAVRLWQSSGRSAEHTARELGISAFNLYEWKQRADRLTRAAGAAGPSGSKEALQAENERLKKELARMTEQRDILKKAAGILSEPPPSGMPGSKR
jgi:transposase